MKSLNEYLSYYDPMREANERYLPEDYATLRYSRVTIIADGKVASIGTANLDIRSFQLNFEINAIIFDSDFTKVQEKIFIDDIKDSKQVIFEEYNNRGRAIRIKEALIRLIAPIL